MSELWSKYALNVARRRVPIFLQENGAQTPVALDTATGPTPPTLASTGRLLRNPTPEYLGVRAPVQAATAPLDTMLHSFYNVSR